MNKRDIKIHYIEKGNMHVDKKEKLSHYRPSGPREFWEVKAPRVSDIDTWRWLFLQQ
jgi:hypothetical protein